MKNIIVVHDKYDDELVIIKVDAITAMRETVTRLEA